MRAHTVKLFVYSSDGKLRHRLLAAIHGHTNQCTLETFADLQSLDERLRHSGIGEIWLLLIISCAGELHRLTAMGELIQDCRSILVLPDQKQDTVAAGHRLYPRFISYQDSDFSDVRCVLETMILNIENQKTVRIN